MSALSARSPKDAKKSSYWDSWIECNRMRGGLESDLEVVADQVAECGQSFISIITIGGDH